MVNLFICLRYYIVDRLNNDFGWKNIKVGLREIVDLIYCSIVENIII